MLKILLIEDDSLIREELKTLLSNQGYQVSGVTDFRDVPRQVREASPDLILLDISLPGQDGYQVCTAVRSFSAVPILFLTGRDTAMDELQALTLGGDDYVSKPYNIPVLLARIGALLRRGAAAAAAAGTRSCPMEHRGVRLDTVTGTLTKDGKSVELTKTELKIMYLLFLHPGEIVPRADIIEYLWDNEIHTDDNTLSVNVMRLREKLRALGENDFIQTRRGMGYQCEN
ncbi:MAG: response regulator transcription factor [Lachnospiraceae bacterium]|nr:response regulator transcription factor [uncultured Acetatifactor sp.]MCI9220394.1 response regulator transcription factor [Lachnospiraceae bacterium]